ncbi:hypothetical protein WA158_005989 [Blastocystis sp. Blastoise]
MKNSSSILYTSELYDVTLVTQTSKERIFYFDHLLKRWKGRISICLLYDDSMADRIDIITGKNYYSPRLSLYPYYSNNTNIYPVNLLRNIAIQHVITTHLWLTDMDMWPAFNLYESLITLPASIINDDKMAVIVPAFEYNMTIPCHSLEECVRVLSVSFPVNKTELIQCVDKEICHLLYLYLLPEWYSTNVNVSCTRVNCFPNKYIMVRKTASLPMFDPRFINYGKNKIQWIEELRYKGWTFSILTNSFAIDIPHPRSRFAVDYIHQWDTNMRKVEMVNLYNSFLKDLYTNNTDNTAIPFCNYNISTASTTSSK